MRYLEAINAQAQEPRVTYPTADLYDEFSESVRVIEPIFQSYGAKSAFGGRVVTLKVFEDNSLVREFLSEPGEERVLVVDGGGSMRCALVGDRLASLAVDNNWVGLVVYGCIRDSHEIASINIGIKALNTNPRKSVKRGAGERAVTLAFGGVTIEPGDYIYCDSDGVLVASEALGPLS